MGSPLSPALAQIVCAWYETQTLDNLRKDNLLNEVEGIRYVDDLTCFIFYDPVSAGDKEKAEDIAKRIQFGYHKNMELEIEDTDKKFKFLSSMIRVNKKNFKIHARFYNKNQRQINEGKPQLFPTYQHFESYAPTRQKLSVAISAIHRIGSACNSTSAVQAAFYTLERELTLLKYPHMIIRRALWRVRNTDDRWHAIRMSRAQAKCSDPSGASRQGGVRHTPSRRVPPGASHFAEWPVRRSRNLKV